jgi:hypothetical protein
VIRPLAGSREAGRNRNRRNPKAPAVSKLNILVLPRFEVKFRWSAVVGQFESRSLAISFRVQT